MPGRKCWIPLPAPGGAVRGPQNVAVIRMPMLQVQTMAPAPTMSATLLTATSFMSCLSEEGNRFSRVYNGENWNPQLRAPLTSPGVNVKAGEYLLAVNGREVRPPENVYSFFAGQARGSAGWASPAAKAAPRRTSTASSKVRPINRCCGASEGTPTAPGRAK